MNVIRMLFSRQDDDDAKDAQPSTTWTVEWKEEMDVAGDELLEATDGRPSKYGKGVLLSASKPKTPETIPWHGRRG